MRPARNRRAAQIPRTLAFPLLRASRGAENRAPKSYCDFNYIGIRGLS